MSLAAAGYAAGLLAFGLLVAWNYFSSALFAGSAATVLFSALALIGTGAGRRMLGLLGMTGLEEDEKTLLGATLGLGLFATGMLFLGVSGLLRPWAAAALLGAMAIAGFGEMRAIVARAAAWRFGGEHALWAAGIGLLLALSFWTTWVPPHQYDALVYHLPLPASYLRAGRITPVEHLIYSHFPQNAEMLFALGLLTGSDLVAQMFSWFATALSVAWIFVWGRKALSPSAVLLACALVASHTSVMLLSATAYVEALVMLWVTAAVLSWCRAAESNEPRAVRAWLLLAGIFAGLGVGVKYTAGVCPAILAFFSVWVWLDRKEGWRRAALFSGAAAAAGAPWLVKNWLVLGNPVFPFLYRELPHRGVAWGAENASRYFNFLTEYGHAPGRFLADIFWVHYRAVAGGVNLGGGMDVIGILGWAPVFGLVPAAAWAVWKDRRLRWIGLYGLLHWAAWFSSVVVLRYLTAIVPLACLLGAAGFYRVREALGARGRFALSAAAVVLIACNVGLFLYVHTLLTSWNVLLGIESREVFLSRMLDYYPCAAWARDHLNAEDKILIAGEQRSYYVEQEAAATTPMAPNRFVEWANRAGTSAELGRLLKKEGGFNYLLVVPREAERLAGYGIFAFTEAGHRNWIGLESEVLEPAFRAPQCAVFRIRS